MIRPRKAWLLGTLVLAGCGLSAVAISGLAGGLTSIVGAAATAYLQSLPAATAIPRSAASASAAATPSATPTAPAPTLQ